MPYLLVAKGGNDGTGAVRDVTRILTGLRWKEVLPPLVISGSLTDAHLAAAREQAATLLAGVDAGVLRPGPAKQQIGRAAGRERVCQSGEISAVGFTLK